MAAPSHLLHHLFRSPQPPTPTSFLSIFLKPTLSLCLQTPIRTSFFTSLSSLPTRPVLFRNSLSSSSSSSISLPHTPSPQSLNPNYKSPDGDEDDNDFDDIDEEEEEEEEEDDEEEGNEQQLEQLELEGTVNESPRPVKATPPPSLTVKEKKELAGYAHSLGKKLKSQLVGKSGVIASVATSFIETLESNELLKIKIHRTCPGELPDVVKQLEEATGSVVVSQIGRAVILYRPSLTKLKAEEKKRQNRRMYVRKELTLTPTFLLQKKGPLPRLSGAGRGRRGSSRV